MRTVASSMIGESRASGKTWADATPRNVARAMKEVEILIVMVVLVEWGG